MAAFFYFRDMETLQSLYASYDAYITGSQLNFDFEEFQLQTLSMYPLESMRSNIDLKVNGKDFSLFMKIKSKRLSSDFLTCFLTEIKAFPNPSFFKEKHFKKINVIKGALASKYPQYNYFIEDINEVMEELEVHLKINEMPKEGDISPGVNSFKNPKIKWLGKTNVLTTLFYDMLHGQDRRSSLIEATQEDIKDFLMNNFLDADGKEMTLDTVVTYMRPDKVDKRAKIGDRVELGNVKLKNKKV
jgi:hypothetical protein